MNEVLNHPKVIAALQNPTDGALSELSRVQLIEVNFRLKEKKDAREAERKAAMRRYRRTGVPSDPAWLAEVERECRMLGRAMTRVNILLSADRQQRRLAGRAQDRERAALFTRAAHKILDERTLDAVWEKAREMANGDPFSGPAQEVQVAQDDARAYAAACIALGRALRQAGMGIDRALDQARRQCRSCGHVHRATRWCDHRLAPFQRCSCRANLTGPVIRRPRASGQ